MLSAVLDVNIVVSAVIAPLGNPRRVIEAWAANRCIVTTAEGIIAEVAQKLRAPGISRRYRLTEADVIATVALLWAQAEQVMVPLKECRQVTGDPEDDDVLAVAWLGRMDYLITGDAGLLGLGDYAGVVILNPRAFLDVLEQAASSR